MTLKETTYRGRKQWRLDMGTVDGIRKIKYYPSKAEAQEAKAAFERRQRAAGARLASLPESRLRDLLRLHDCLEARAIAPDDIVALLDSTPKVTTPIDLVPAIEYLVQAKTTAGRRPAYTRTLFYYLNQFAATQPTKKLHEITAEDIELWFTSRSEPASARKSNIGRLSALFEYGIRRGWATENPTRKIETPALEHGQITILPVEDCRRLLEASKSDPGMQTYCALALFVGLRPNECHQIRAEHIRDNGKTIVVEGKHAKTRRRRIIETEPGVAELLVEPGPWTNFRNRWAAVRKKAGVTLSHDVLRHTAATHLLNRHESAEKTALILGNSPQILFQHYREVVGREESVEFWSLLSAPDKAPMPTDPVATRSAPCPPIH